MLKKDLKIANEVKERFAEFVNLLDTRVFGSCAKGGGDEYSDLDLFVEVPFINKELKEKMFDVVWDVGFKNLKVVSLFVFTQEEIENSPLRASPLVKNILEEGIKI
ncbi:MAG: nucleotidyltransferase domain-containing protein [bacterium]